MITKYCFLLSILIYSGCSTYKEVRPKNTSEYSQSKSVTKKYNRKYFKHWIDQDKDCKNTRAEVLEARSLKKVTYRKRKNGKNCTVHSGLWDDYYFNEQHTLASKVDIDHIVPLKHAWVTGASN